VALVPADLAALAGSYVAEAGPLEASVEAAPGKLKVSLPGGRSFVLVPVSPTRFRIVGSLSTFVVFELEGGRGSRMTVEEGGVADLSLKLAVP